MQPPPRLKLLGALQLVLDGRAVPVEGKTAAVLAYLALEGPTPRGRLAALLWPESDGAVARGNLRQLLRRLRVAAGGDVLAGGEVLALDAALRVDVLELREHARAGRHAEALAVRGELLEPLDEPQLPALASWLVYAREELSGLRRRAAAQAADAREAAGDLQGALAVAEQHLALEPTSEQAFRRLMRLHYLHGDRAAALGLYAQCRQVLERELGASPMEETVALAREIERGRGEVPRARASAPLPVSVLRPPVLAGREREWAALERAWEAGQIIWVSGEPGVGKSRLVRDFVASKGAFAWVEGRPGDAGVPLSSHARHLRRLLALRPQPELAPWVREGLARVLPEYQDAAHPVPQMASEADRLRFLEAQLHVFRRSIAGLAAIVIDDVQFHDDASNEVGEYMFSHGFPLGEPGGLTRVISIVRKGEMAPNNMAIIERAVAAGMGALVELEPLRPGAVGALLDGLGLPGAERLADDLARYTGGNPLYIVETLKHLLETGGLGRGWPAELPPPGRVAPLIQARLGRLSPLALQLAQVAALARDDFRLELAGAVLEVSPLALAGPLAELESSQIFAGGRFSHDLVFEAVRGGIPAPLRAYLHRRLAAQLEQRGTAPDVLAQHWLRGEEPQRAVPHLRAAARLATEALRPADAETRLRQAAELLEHAGSVVEAEALRAQARALPRPS